MVTHSSILAWRIPWTEEPGRLQSIESQRVRHDWSNKAHVHISQHREVLPQYLHTLWASGKHRHSLQGILCIRRWLIRQKKQRNYWNFQGTPSRHKEPGFFMLNHLSPEALGTNLVSLKKSERGITIPIDPPNKGWVDGGKKKGGAGGRGRGRSLELRIEGNEPGRVMWWWWDHPWH